MSGIVAVASITILENLRKKILYVLLLVSVFLVGGTLLINVFSLGAQSRIVKDLSISFIHLFLLIIAVSLAATTIPHEIETRTIYATLTKPLSRRGFLWGKFFGIMGIVLMNLMVLSLELFLVLYLVTSQLPWALFPVLLMITVECGLATALALLFSTLLTPPVTMALSVLSFVLGSLSPVYLELLRKEIPPLGLLAWIINGILPRFEYFHTKAAVVHGYSISPFYLAGTSVYGILFILLFISLADLLFSRRDL